MSKIWTEWNQRMESRMIKEISVVMLWTKGGMSVDYCLLLFRVVMMSI